MAKDYSSMSLVQLGSEQAKVMEQRQALSGEGKAIQTALDGKQAEIEARCTLERMSDPEKAALAQALGVRGVESEEAVGTPGG